MDLTAATDLCTFCPRLCSDRCPVSLAEARETVTPQAKMARLSVLGRGPLHQAAHDTDERGPLSTLPLYACTGCGACTDSCLHKVEPSRHLMTGRALVTRHHAGHPALRDLPRRHRQRAQAASAAAAAAVPEERQRPDARSAYLPPCTAGHDSPAKDAQRMLRIADRIPALNDGGQMGLAAAGCAGYPLYAGGFAEEFRLYAEVFARTVSGHETLVVGCPACTWLLRQEYGAHGVPVRPTVLHSSELLGRHAEALPVTQKLGAATYHDPCHLGRRLGVYDEPRAALSRAFEQLDEFPRSRSQAACSGGGALLPLTAPATARAMADERLQELGDPAAVLVTACGSCQKQLGRGRRVLGLLEAIDEATGPG